MCGCDKITEYTGYNPLWLLCESAGKLCVCVFISEVEVSAILSMYVFRCNWILCFIPVYMYPGSHSVHWLAVYL